MPGYLNNTISALVHDLSSLHGDPQPDTCNRILRFVTAQMDRMPSFLALAIRTATLGFGASRFLLEGSLFHRRDSDRRRVQVDSWRRSRLGPCRDLIKFYSSLVVLALYSPPQASPGGVGRDV